MVWREVGKKKCIFQVDSKTFNVVVEDETRGRYVRISERGNGFFHSIFLERDFVVKLKRFVENIISKGSKASVLWRGEGAFRDVSVLVKSNARGRALFISERPVDRRKSLVIIPEGIGACGWSAFTEALGSSVFGETQMVGKVNTALDHRRLGGDHISSYASKALLPSLSLAGKCSVFERGSSVFFQQDRASTERRREFLKSCLVGKFEGDGGSIKEIAGWASKVWRVATGVEVHALYDG